MWLRLYLEPFEMWEEDYKENGYNLLVPAPVELAPNPAQGKVGGFEAGKCYSFAVTLEDGVLSMGYEGSCNVGSYTINTEWGQED